MLKQGFLALTALIVVALATAPAQAEVTVLKNFTLIDGTGRAPVANSALIMDNGRISWVGPAAQLKSPAGAKVVDLTGKFVMPGIIDNHVHVGTMHDQTQDVKYYTRENVERDLHIYAAYGVTTVQVLGTDKDLIFDIRKEQRAGRPSEARVFTASQGIVFKGGYGGLVGLNEPVANPQEAIKRVDEDAAKGADFIKLWMDDEHRLIPVKMPYDVSTAVIAEAHKHNLKAVAHVYYLADAKELVREGINGFAHEPRDMPVDQEFINLMKSHGTWQMAGTLSRELAYSYAIMPYLLDPFFVRGVTPGTLDLLRSPARLKAFVLDQAAVVTMDTPTITHTYKGVLFPDYDRVYRQALANFGTEVKAGIPYGMGTDSGPPGRFAGFNAHVEMQMEVIAGVTPMQAIVAATSSNAKWLGDNDIGSVAVGKWADLLVLDADPSADIRNTRTIDSVYVAGNSVPTIWQTCRDRPVNACTGEPLTAPPLPY